MSVIQQRIQESIEVKTRILNDSAMIAQIETAAEWILRSLKNGGKVLFCGNGGSATDALHLTGEFIGKFQKERRSMPAIALNANVASLTAVANDYHYDFVFSRAVEGLMKPEDILVGISTSGNSKNILQAVRKANEIGGQSIGLLGNNGGSIKEEADLAIVVPHHCTARIQESHIMIGHIICEIVEERMFGECDRL